MNAHTLPAEVQTLAAGLDFGVISAVVADLRADDFPVVHINPAFLTLTGHTTDTVGLPLLALLDDDGDRVRAALHDAGGTRTPVTLLVRCRRVGTAAFLAEVNLRPVVGPSGEATHVVAFVQDVSALHRAQDELHHLRATLDQLPEPVMAFDRDLTTTYVNAAAASTAQQPPDTLIGKPLLAGHPEVTDTPAVVAARRTLDTGVAQQVTTYSERLSKALKATAYPAPNGVAVLLQDVTTEQTLERDLRASQDRFAKVFEASPLAIIITRLRDGHFVDVNPAFTQLSGFTRDEVIGQTSEDLQVWPRSDQRDAMVRRLRERGRVLDGEVQFRDKSGELRTAIASMVPIFVAGEPCVVTLVRDVSTERRAVQEAQGAAAELQRTLNLSLDLITTIDADGRFMTVNAAATRLLGYTPDELVGRPYLDFVHPDDRERTLEAAAILREAQELATFQNRYVRKHGGLVWLDWTSVSLPDGVIFATARDVTLQRTTTDDLAFLAAIVRASTDAIIGLTLDGRVRSWNAGAERMYGHSAAEMIGRQITDIVPPELLEEEAQLLERAAQGEYTPATETTRLSRLGHRIPVQLSIAPIFDGEGTVVGISKIAQDISARREAERQILQLNTTLQRKLAHLTGLREIDQAIASSLDLTITLGVVLEQLREQLGADAAVALLLDPHALTLRYAATCGLTHLPPDTTLRLGEGVAGQVALTREPAVINDLRAAPLTPAWRDVLDREGLTAYAAVPLIAKRRVLGVIGALRRESFDDTSDWLETLQTLAGQAAIAIDNAQMFQDLERRNLELGLAYHETIEGWARALDLRDKETEGHSRRVTEMTVALCRALGLPAADLVHAQRGALLHDIGKMGIADAILLKPGALTADEWVEMRKHPGYAVELLSPIQFLRPALDIPQSHHEKWDGSGYPQGLQGAAIPLTARAFAVVDVYDALTNDRPYRKAWSRDRALAHIQAQAGTHFDPAVVQAFMALIERNGT